MQSGKRGRKFGVFADDEAMVRSWIKIHREELFANWQLLSNGEPFFKIEPLR